MAQENLKRYGKTKEVEFVCVSAEKYEIEEADCFYFLIRFLLKFCSQL